MRFQEGAGRGEGLRQPTLALQQSRERGQDPAIVVHQIDDAVQVGHAPLRFTTGSEKLKIEPPPGFSSNQISP